MQGSSTSNAGVRAFSETGWGLITETFTGVALLVIGHLEVQGDAVGQSILQAGQTEVTVTTPAATAVSNVLLTPLANPCGQLWVTRAAGNFTIHTSEAPRDDVPIAYLIIN